MGAIENTEQLKDLLADCVDQTQRIWNLGDKQSYKDMIKSRLNVVSDYLNRMEDVAGDVIVFCKDLIESNPRKYYEYYSREVFNPLNKVLGEEKEETSWYRSFSLLVCYYDEVKIYEREERDGICKYHYYNDGKEEWVTKNTFSNGIWRAEYKFNYQERYYALYEYCKLKDIFEYKLLSRLCHFKDSRQGNVNTDFEMQLFLFAHTLCLYITMSNERRQLLKDSKYAGVKLEELNDTTTTNNNGTKKIINRCDEEHHPSVFISYSSGDEKHDAWVLRLADNLMSKGVLAYIDKYDIKPAQHIPHYMEDSIKKADRILVIGTPEYKIKAEGQERGVGFEYTIISTEIMSKVGTERFIPILRIGTWDESFPPLIRGCKGYDMTNDCKYEEALMDLLRGIYNKPKIVRPPLGEKPNWG